MNCVGTPSPKNCHPFLFFRSPTSFQKPSPVCFLWLIFVCIQWVSWRYLAIRRIVYLLSWGRLILSYWQNDKKNLTNAQGAVPYQAIHHWNWVFPYNLSASCGPGSVVGIATAYGLDGRGSNTVGARFSAPVQTVPEAHPTSCKMGTGSFARVICGQGVTLTPHHLTVPTSKIE